MRAFALALPLAFVACAHVPLGPLREVAIAPVDSMGVAASEGAALRSAMERQLANATAHHAVERARLGAI